MSNDTQSVHWAEQARFAILVLLLVLCLLFGGGSRSDIFGALVVQCAAVVAAVAALLLPGPTRFLDVRAPLLLLAAFAVTIAIQLIPLPPGLWAALPAHGPFAELAAASGIEPVWRPISLTPDLTRESLAGLVVPAAVLIVFATLPLSRTYKLLPFLIGMIVLSGLLGIAQVAGGKDSSLYQYRITNHGSAVGFFSNRNHQAVLLALGIPLVWLWGSMATLEVRGMPIQRWISYALIVFLLPVLLVTGSRAGLLLALVGFLFSWAMLRGKGGKGSKRTPVSTLMAGGIAAAIGIGVIGITVFLSRAEAINRLFSASVSGDMRSQSVSKVVEITRDFFPFGSGFGSFDRIFRFYEPDALLRPNYLNHAHNDLLELVMTGGLPALVVAIALVIWVGFRAWRAFFVSEGAVSLTFAKASVAIILIIFMSSLVDYPLRTPLLMAICALACGWLASYRDYSR